LSLGIIALETGKFMDKIRLCRIATVPFVLLSYRKHIEKLQEYGCDITIVTSVDENFETLKSFKVSNIKGISIIRDISPLRDLITLIKLFIFFRKNKFDIIHSNTPKAGLLAALAGYFTNSLVIHTFTGQRWQTLSGPAKFVLKSLDRLVILLNHTCYTDSWSQKDFLLSQGIGSEDRIKCIHKGGFAGVDIERFSKARFDLPLIKEQNNISSDDVVITFVGRITRDKGINELITAFLQLEQEIPNIKLLLVGPLEKEHKLESQSMNAISTNKNILTIGYTIEPEMYLAVSDIFCLPSHREGFGTVILESAAMEIPSVGTNISGLCDAIIPEKTGLLVTKGNYQELAHALKTLITNPKLRESMGIEARNRIELDFNLNLIANKNYEEYIQLLKNKKGL